MKHSDKAAEFCVTHIQHFMQRWKKCVDNEADCVEKLSELCKGCDHDIYVHFIIIVIKVSKKEIRRHFVPPLVTFRYTWADLW